MEADLYFKPIFWPCHGMPRKMRKRAGKNCIFAAENREP